MRTYLVLLLALMSAAPALAQRVEFGVGTKFDQGMTGLRMIDEIVDAGVKINRDAVNWQKVEVVEGRPAWPVPYQTMFEALAKRGIRSNVILMTRNQNYDGGLFPTSPKAVAAFARFAAFTAQTLRGQTVAFEIGNEWRPGPGVSGPTTFRDYVTLFTAAATAIHRVDPAARVVADPAIYASVPATAIPAVGTPVGDHVRRALALADGVVVHQYPHQMKGMSFDQAQAEMVAAMTRRAAWLETIAGRPVPLYVTEYGWPIIAQRGLTPAEQAVQIARTTRALAAMPFVRLAILYELTDSCANMADPECTFGLYQRRDRERLPKPALAAFRSAVTAKP